MNYPLLRYLFGMILLIVAAFLVLPLAVAVIYGESSGIYFLYTMIAAGLLGFLLTRFKPAKRDMYAREGFVFTALAWVVISLIGACLFRVVWIFTVFSFKPSLEIIYLSYPISWTLVAVSYFIVIDRTIRKLRLREKREAPKPDGSI